jgi:hypothetical protein
VKYTYKPQAASASDSSVAVKPLDVHAFSKQLQATKPDKHKQKHANTGDFTSCVMQLLDPKCTAIGSVAAGCSFLALCDLSQKASLLLCLLVLGCVSIFVSNLLIASTQ